MGDTGREEQRKGRDRGVQDGRRAHAGERRLAAHPVVGDDAQGGGESHDSSGQRRAAAKRGAVTASEYQDAKGDEVWLVRWDRKGPEGSDRASHHRDEGEAQASGTRAP